MIEKMRMNLEKGGTSVALLTEFSKAFDCLRNDLLIAKLHAQGNEEGSFKGTIMQYETALINDRLSV